jgi:hypothetical protein
MNAFGHRVGRRSMVTALSCAVLAVVGLGTPTSVSASTGRGTTSFVPTPLATSVQSSAGTWVTLPMGRLNQPLNTFWQLFFRPTGMTTWSDKVGATATATNGGLIMAAAVAQPFVVGVRPANLLHFSPLVATTDGGNSWSNGLLPHGLADSPDSLSLALDGRAVALVKNGLDAQVLVNQTGLSRWRTLTTARRLATGTGGPTCGLRSLSAVAVLASSAFVGATCARPGTVGIFVERSGNWHLDQPVLPEALRQGRVEVLRLDDTSSGLSALLGITTKVGEAFVGATMPLTGGAWKVSSALSFASHERLASFGPANASGVFVLGTLPSGSTRLAVLGALGGWSMLPAPPRFTDTVAFDPANAATVEALTAHGATMSVWSLAPGAGSWNRGQILHVALTYGSSS